MAQTVTVTIRKLGKDVGRFKKGQVVLVLNPRVFGSKGENWLGQVAYDTREEAIAAAKKMKATVIASKTSKTLVAA